MLEPAVRGAASGTRRCYNRLGVKLRPPASFAGSGHRRCYNLHRRMLQPSTTRATSSDGEIERRDHGVDFAGMVDGGGGGAATTTGGGDAMVCPPIGTTGRSGTTAETSCVMTAACCGAPTRATDDKHGHRAAEERLLRGHAGGQRARMKTSGCVGLYPLFFFFLLFL